MIINADILAEKFEKAWRMCFESIKVSVRNTAGLDENNARQFANEVVHPFRKRILSLDTEVFEWIESKIGFPLPMPLREIFAEIDLAKTVVWNTHFSLEELTSSNVPEDQRYLYGVVEQSLDNFKTLNRIPKNWLTLGFIGEDWIAFDLASSEWPLVCFDPDGRELCRAARDLSEYLSLCADLTIAQYADSPISGESIQAFLRDLPKGVVTDKWLRRYVPH